MSSARTPEDPRVCCQPKHNKKKKTQDFNFILNWNKVSNGTGKKRAEAQEPRQRQKLDWGHHAQIAIVDAQPIIHLSPEKFFFSFWNLVASALAGLETLLSLEWLRYRHLLGRPALCWAHEIVQISFPSAWYGSQVWRELLVKCWGKQNVWAYFCMNIYVHFICFMNISIPQALKTRKTKHKRT